MNRTIKMLSLKGAIFFSHHRWDFHNATERQFCANAGERARTEDRGPGWRRETHRRAAGDKASEQVGRDGNSSDWDFHGDARFVDREHQPADDRDVFPSTVEWRDRVGYHRVSCSDCRGAADHRTPGGYGWAQGALGRRSGYFHARL